MRSHRSKPLLDGSNEFAVAWAADTAEFYGLSGCETSVLYVVASWTRRSMWDRFRLCISWIQERVSYSRSAVEKALRKLRDLRLILQDGEAPCDRRRPVVKYRLGGTPECPLPEEVSEAREQAWREAQEQDPEWEPQEDVYAGQSQNYVYHLQTGGFTSDNRSSGSLCEDNSQGEPRADIYPSALPMKTGPEAGPEPTGSARREPHLGLLPVGAGPAADRRTTRRVARGFARRLLGLAVPRKVSGAGGVREEVSPAVCQPGSDLPVEAKIAVTYSPRTTERAAMTPFTDPALGTLPIGIRLFYLGLRSLADTASMIVSDTRYLKAELFRYDDDITPTDISNWINTLADTGKIHNVPGHLLLSDPNTEAPADGSLFAFPAAPAPLKQNNEQDFDTFWHYYPRRTGKGAARKAFLAAVAKGTPAHRIIEAAASYANTCQMIGKEIQFTPHPSVWLNQERWDDDPEQAPQVRSRADDAFRQNMQTVEHYRQQELGNGGLKEIGPSW